MGEKIRKLAAIMFTDIVGYSRMVSVDERHGLALLERHDELLMPIILKHGGRVLKKIGDAVFAEFTSSVNAVESAIEIQTALKEYNKPKESKDHIVIRIGIHMGDVVVHDDDLFGEGINVAAKLEPLAEPGGICMSQAVYQSVRAHMGVDAIKVGEVELKTIRIGFLDVRDVDKVLEYFVTQIGFKPPTRIGEHLVFRAKPMTVLTWNVFKIKAKVNGNTIILTGPLRMVLKLRKQIASFASKE
jgi:hypothetical protein